MNQRVSRVLAGVKSSILRPCISVVSLEPMPNHVCDNITEKALSKCQIEGGDGVKTGRVACSRSGAKLFLLQVPMVWCLYRAFHMKPLRMVKCKKHLDLFAGAGLG